MTTKQITARPAALRQARALAKHKDGWMTPTDDHLSAEALVDYGTYETEQQEGWEETCHFTTLYGDMLREIGYKDAYAQGFDEADHEEAALYFHELFYEPLKAAFWEEWAETHKLYEYWEKNVKAKAKRRRQ